MSNPSQPIFSRSSNFERRMFFCVWTFLPFYVSIFIFSCASRQPEKLVYCPEMVWTFITQTEMRPWCRALGITFPVAKQDNLPQLKVNQKGWLAIAKLKPLSLFISLLSMLKKAFVNVKIEK